MITDSGYNFELERCENVKAAEISKSVRKWLFVHGDQRWYSLLVKDRQQWLAKNRRRLNCHFDMMLNGERVQAYSIWIRILAGENLCCQAKSLQFLENQRMMRSRARKHYAFRTWTRVCLTLYWKWSVLSRRRKRGRTKWLAIHVVEWKSLFWIERDILCTRSEYERVRERESMSREELSNIMISFDFWKIRKTRCTCSIQIIEDNMVISKKDWKSINFEISKFC